MQQENLITDGGMKTPTLTLAPMGMEVPRTTDLWKADSAFFHWAMQSITSTNQNQYFESISRIKSNSKLTQFQD